MKINEKLKLLRSAKGLTQKQLSELLKITKSAYQKYESGIIKPAHRSMVKICQQFPRHALWLMTDSVGIMKLNEKLKVLRTLNNCAQKEFSELIEVREGTYQGYEYGTHIPGGRVIQKLCQQFPEYALWLMTDDVDVKAVENKALKENKENKHLGGELPRSIFMTLSAKLKLLRGTKGLTQKRMSELLEVREVTYQMYEYQKYISGGRVMQKLCNQFPEYTLWLMTDIDNIENIKNQAIKQ
jgi:transcriptional regulator with XRE-family HTH domain